MSFEWDTPPRADRHVVVDNAGRTDPARTGWHVPAGMAVSALLGAGLILLGVPWWLAAVLGAFCGQYVLNRLAARRDARLRAAQAAERPRPGVPAPVVAPEDVVRAERVALLRVAVEAGLHWVDYDTGTVLPPAEAAELLRQEDRRAALEDAPATVTGEQVYLEAWRRRLEDHPRARDRRATPPTPA